MAGFDFGLKKFLTSSDFNDIEAPLFFIQNIKAIKSANRVLSRKKKKSKSRAQAVKVLNRVHKKAANQRKDWQWKTAKQLTDGYDYFFFEDLNINGMKAMWGRKVSDLSFYSFLLKVEQ